MGQQYIYIIEQAVMNQKKQVRNDSPPNDRRTSSDSKRGIFTSNQAHSFKPNVMPYLQQSLQGQNKYIQHLHPHRINQSLSFINSSYTNGSTHHLPAPIHQSYIHEQTSHTPPKVQFIYPQGSVSQHNIPGGYTTSQHYIDTRNQHVQYIPIENNRDKTQIRRTVVPVHITNEIPTKIVVNPPTPQYQPYTTTHIEQSHNDQAYQILLKQYQKLYERLSKQQLYNQQLQKQITRLKQQPPPKIPTPKHIQPTIHIHHPEQKNIQIRRKYGINMKQLHDKLFKIYKKVVDDVVSRKKQQTQDQLRGYFAAARKEIVVSSTQVVEHSIKTYKKN